MFNLILQVYQYIINKDNNEFNHKWPEEPVHHMHVVIRALVKPKDITENSYNHIDPEYNEKNIFLLNSHLMITTTS